MRELVTAHQVKEWEAIASDGLCDQLLVSPRLEDGAVDVAFAALGVCRTSWLLPRVTVVDAA